MDTIYLNYPVVNVTWDSAFAYCAWVGGRLPSEAEWEKAGRGTDGRKYPWGNSFDETKANAHTDQLHFYLQPVDSYPNGVSPYGVFNMLGNAGEWVNDRYAGDYYLNSPSKNPTGPSTGTSHQARSGVSGYSWVIAIYSRGGGNNGIGFRCASDISP
jgi:formylglycine-generating enzyme required for sulfatase activity